MRIIEEIFKNPPKVVSFDFDDTLAIAVYKIPQDYSNFEFNYETKLSPKIKEIIKKLFNFGSEIHLVTSRNDSLNNREAVYNFLKDNDIFQYFKEFHLVGDNKAHVLKEIGSELHFDDDRYEFEFLESNYPDHEVKFIQLSHPEVPGEIKDEDSWNFKSLNNLMNILSKRGYRELSIKIRNLLKNGIKNTD